MLRDSPSVFMRWMVFADTPKWSATCCVVSHSASRGGRRTRLITIRSSRAMGLSSFTVGGELTVRHGDCSPNAERDDASHTWPVGVDAGYKSTFIEPSFAFA